MADLNSLQEGRERGKGPQTMTFKRSVRGNLHLLLLDETVFSVREESPVSWRAQGGHMMQ